MDNMYIALLNSMSEGASIIEPNGHIVFINDSYLKSIGEERDFMLAENLLTEEHNKRLSTSVIKEVLDTRQEVRKSQIYLNTSGYLFDVLCYEKPIFHDNELHCVLTFAEKVRAIGHIDQVGGEIPDSYSQNDFVYKSLSMQKLVSRIQKVASLPSNILLVGETGVGKDKMAEFIYKNSLRKNKPFIAVNCAALAENLIESELFGYEKGAFTGANREGRKGLIEQANGGTLFLDEINSLPLNLQGKFLRTLETKMIRPVGGVTERLVDFRLIAASNADLMECVKNKTFREDLFYRINTFMEIIPPLRERREDIIPLANYFLNYFSQRYNTNMWIPLQMQEKLQEYDWPGNIRELRNFVERLSVVGIDSVGIDILPTVSRNRDFKVTFRNEVQSGTLRQRMQNFEAQIIKEALNSCKTKKEAAKMLGIDAAVLSRKIVQYNL